MGNFFNFFKLTRESTTSNNISNSKSCLSIKSQNFIDTIKINNKQKIIKLKDELNIFPKLNFEILENSIKLVKDNNRDNLYHLEFIFSTSLNILLKIYFNAFYDDLFNFSSDVKNVIQLQKNEDEEDLINNDNNTFKFFKGNNLKFSKGNYSIDLNDIKFESLIKISRNFPLVIEIIPFYKDDKEYVTDYGYKFPKIDRYIHIIEFNQITWKGNLSLTALSINNKLIKLEKWKEDFFDLNFKSSKNL